MIEVKAKAGTRQTARIAAAIQRATCASLLTGSLLTASLIAAPLPAFAQSAASASGASTAATTKPKRPLTPGQIAARERQKKCAAEWKEAKAAGKVEKGTKWPQYWSACNKRLKGTAT